MFYRTIKVLSVAALAVMVGFGAGPAAAASPAPPPAGVSTTHNATGAAATARPQIQAAAAALRAGETVQVKVSGGVTESLQVRSGTLQVTRDAATAAGAAGTRATKVSPKDVCATVVTGAIIGLGAAALGAIIAIALLTPGVDVITIVGVTLTIGEWSAIAAVMSSVSAVYALVSAWVC